MPAAPASRAPDPSGRRGTLSLFDLLCLGTNAIVGSGIYAFPGLLAEGLGPASFLAFVVSGLVSAVIGLCFAEAAALFDRSGGPYVYARAAFGGWIGYGVGWSCWAAALLSWAAVTRALMPLLAQLSPAFASETVGVVTVVAITVVLGAINYRGVRPGAVTTDIFTVAKLAPLILLVGAGLRKFSVARLSPFAPHGLGALPRESFRAFFAYQGFEVVPVPAAESKDPRRNAPIALLGSLGLTTALYVTVQVVAVGTTPDLAGAADPLTRMGRAVLGDLGAQAVNSAAIISMLGFCAGVALAGPRYVEALASDGYLPASVAARHPRFDTPGRAIALTTGLTVVLVVLLPFERLVDLSVVTVSLQYLATCAAVVVLRRREPNAERRFRVPGGSALPVLAIAMTITLTTIGLYRETAVSKLLLTFVALVVVGIVPGVIWSRRPRG